MALDSISRAFVQPGEWRLKRWLLFHGDRERVAGVLLLGVFVSLHALGLVRPIQYRALLAETTVLQSIFNTLLGGVILLVSIVVSVASVGVSQELTTVGEQADRVDSAIAYRNQVADEEHLGVSPAQTGAFLATVLQSVKARASELDEVTKRYDDSAFRDRFGELLENIHRNAAELLETLEQVDPGTTDELIVGLDYDASWQLHVTNELLRDYDEQLAPIDVERLEELQNTLRHFLIGREYFKSIYYKRELADLSTTLLFVSLPVIVFISYVMLAIDAGVFPEVTILGLSPLSVFINLAYTIALAPYVLLTSYVFRAASITTRTVAAGPFVHAPEQEVNR